MAAEVRKDDDHDWKDLLVLTLIDITKAYTRVQRLAAWKVFKRLGMPNSLLKVLRGLHEYIGFTNVVEGRASRMTTHKPRGFVKVAALVPFCIASTTAFPSKTLTCGDPKSFLSVHCQRNLSICACTNNFGRLIIRLTFFYLSFLLLMILSW